MAGGRKQELIWLHLPLQGSALFVGAGDLSFKPVLSPSGTVHPEETQ